MTRGGTRPGAGRPPAPTTKHRRQVYLSDETWKRLGNTPSKRIGKLVEDRMNREQKARERIAGMNFTDAQLEFIWADWENWDEHIDWLLTVSREEIVSWIEASK